MLHVKLRMLYGLYKHYMDYMYPKIIQKPREPRGQALARGQASIWPNGQALWCETTETYDAGYVSFGAWGQEAI